MFKPKVYLGQFKALQYLIDSSIPSLNCSTLLGKAANPNSPSSRSPKWKHNISSNLLINIYVFSHISKYSIYNKKYIYLKNTLGIGG